MNDSIRKPPAVQSSWPDYKADEPIPIPQGGTWPRSVHVFHWDTVAALLAAEVTGRPLLLRGEPGSGKSETARAAATVAGRPFVSVVIDGRTEPNDLKWRFDAVARLADAQVVKKSGDLPDERAYLVPGPLWWAYDAASAQQRLKEVNQSRRHSLAEPWAWPEKDWSPESGRLVLLIDEIDKADPDLPNALLEVLANLGFCEPYGGQEIRCSEATRPLVIITTNEERELPHAFLRRCLVHRLELPLERTELIKRLVSLGERHQTALELPAPCSPAILELAAKHVADARDELRSTGQYMPGTSEYLDMVKVLAATDGGAKAREDKLKQIGKFTLHKGSARHR